MEVFRQQQTFNAIVIGVLLLVAYLNCTFTCSHTLASVLRVQNSEKRMQFSQNNLLVYAHFVSV